jgi:hypothetical protein
VPAVSEGLLRLKGRYFFRYGDRTSGALSDSGGQHCRFLAGSTDSFLEESTLKRFLILQKVTNATVRNGTCPRHDIDNFTSPTDVAHRDFNGADGAISN